jgi:hypothetical protein
MGNFISTNKTESSEKKFGNIYEVIDYIATYYILTMDFKSLSKLSEREYCDKLVILTSDLIERYFNDMEVTYLAQRVKGGLEINELAKEKVMFLTKDQLEYLDVSNDAQKSIKKKRVCIGIAKFYVKIAHIFAAIVKTINPVYIYKDETGNTVKTPLLEKDKIPKNVKREIAKLNICDNRIKALMHNEVVSDDGKEVTIQPKVCNMNYSKESGLLSLSDEPGIAELMQLYLDDNYDYSNGTFTGMSEETKKQFQKDLKLFYTIFTGNEEMPNYITKFSDIKLRDYKQKMGCQGRDAPYNKKYTMKKNEKLFENYAKNIRNMIQSAASKQNELLSIINELFSYVIDPRTNKKVIRVNPKLTDELLQKIIVKTRGIIIELYVKCETDYVNGIKLYEAIVESKIIETTQKQIENLQKEANNIVKTTVQKIDEERNKLNNKDVTKNMGNNVLTNIPNNLPNNVPNNMENNEIKINIQEPIKASDSSLPPVVVK